MCVHTDKGKKSFLIDFKLEMLKNMFSSQVQRNRNPVTLYLILAIAVTMITC